MATFPMRLKSQMTLITSPGTSLAVQWLKLCASTAGGLGSISGQGTKILHATQCGQKQKKKEKVKKK